MLINLSDVLSDQHKTVEETVRLEMEEIRLHRCRKMFIKRRSMRINQRM